MSVTTDTIATWDTRDADVGRVEAEFANYLKVAQEIGDPGSITVATADLDDLRSARAAYHGARKPLDEAVHAATQAEAELAAAKAAEAAGALDKRDAWAKFEAVVLASAKVRHWASKIPSLLASASGSRERMSRAAGASTGRSVVEETMGYVKKVFEYKSLRTVISDAETEGRRARADRVAFWLIGEEITRREFARRLPEETAKRERAVSMMTTNGLERDWRREDPWIPSLADLESVFRARRAALDGERARVKAQFEAMSDQVQTMEGV